MSRVLVVGGGITGLTAALTLFHDNVDVELIEAGERVGGKVLTTHMAGVPVDAGPDAFLIRDPHMADLCAQLNLSDALVSPAHGSASLWHRGALRALPRKQYLGVPLDFDDLAASGILSDEGLARARQDLTAPADAPSLDESAGALIRRRLGDEVLERLVGPLLGGINAGNADSLSLAGGVPQLAAAAGHDASLVSSVRIHLSTSNRDPKAPIFQSHPNGLGQVVDTLLQTRLGPRIHLSQPVQSIERRDNRWIVHATDEFEADAVVVATPAFASAAILRSNAPRTAELLDDIEYASVIMTTFAFRADALPAFDGSGFLIPRHEGLLMTACSWASTKWAHLGEGPTAFLRVSAGRAGDTRAMEMDDESLVDRLLEELQWTAGITAAPTEVRITRWPSSFPQYRPGHLERVEAIDDTLAAEAPGLAVAGAAFRGLGLPACVHQGRRAAWAEDYLGIERDMPAGPGMTRPAPGQE